MVNLQLITNATDVPSAEHFEHWAKSALQQTRGELTVRVVDREESRILNRNYRGKDKPTNVLSFPFEAPMQVSSSYLGDLVICAPVVAIEAREQGKSVISHWAHMVIHGILHLQGYDHQSEVRAEEMEHLEKQIMGNLGYPDPYAANN